jgi:hypothetical protein
MPASLGRPLNVISLLISILVIYISLTGIFVPGFYKKETVNWQAQSVGQDLINLCIVIPVLLCGAILIRKFEQFYFIWAGSILYLIYTFIIYCFDIHFNRLFFLYCIVLGLSFFSALHFFTNSRNLLLSAPAKRITRITSVYFMIVGIAFYGLWLMGILPAIINNTVPKELQQTGLITNPVHVLDLSIVLPGIFMTGIMLWRGKTTGYLLTPIILVFFILMDITIGFLALYMQYNGLGNMVALATIMGGLAIFSLFLLMTYVKVSKPLAA